MRYHLLTLGCPKNTVDSEGMAGLLADAGYKPTQRPDRADVLIVNTCGFIGPARDESIGALRELGRRKRPHQLLIATGCLVQRAGASLQRELPEVDAILSTRRWYEIANLVAQLRQDRYGDIPAAGLTAAPDLLRANVGLVLNRDEAMPAQAIAAPVARRPVGTSAYLKIADGCSAPCAFCTIPGIKGPWRSKPLAAIVQEAEALVTQGVREIILIAQDTTAYGYDWGQRDQLAPLLDSLCASLPGDIWLRLMYAFPGRVTPRLVESMARHSQIVHYLDMPLQHGDAATLARMRRPSPSVAARNIRDLRAAMPDIAIRSGFIVGYPGETEAEFQGLLDFLAEHELDKVGVFTFCQEDGTPAGAMPDQVPQAVKEERRDRAMELQQAISLRRNRAQVGRTLDVLIEGVGDGISVGRSYRDAPEVDGMVLIQHELASGQRLPITISGAMAYDLLGQPATSDDRPPATDDSPQRVMQRRHEGHAATQPRRREGKKV
ncbi:MAG: 30S ribosomal protein S12 methylthiotransferase RimO [Anaerolineae bacterium]|nr:30S ribosomal protein S12 methylthiotransferase RimO [Anaerolineae bacterium]